MINRATRWLQQLASMGELMGDFSSGQRNGARGSADAGDGRNEDRRVQRDASKDKWITFRAKAKSKREVEWSPGSRPLEDYLALPASEYSLLDPELVERVSDDAFLVTLPVGDLFSWGMADQAPGTNPQVVVRTMHHSDGQGVTLSFESALGEEPIEASGEVALTSADSGKTSQLLKGDCSADCKCLIPHPTSSVPSFALRAIASLVANACTQALLPRFLELLDQDYQRFARDDSQERFRSSGSLRVDAPPE